MTRDVQLSQLLDSNGDVKTSALGNAPDPITKSATAPSNPAAGDLWYDTSNKAMKHYDGGNWLQMSNKFTATGGTEATDTANGFKYHVFTSSGSFTSESSGEIEYLVVAGGGGGSSGDYSTGGGGGGAGGVISGTANVTAQSYSIVVGGAGVGQAWQNTGGNGGNSYISSVSATALGGGAGGGYQVSNGVAGGSGGGGTWPNELSGGAGTAGQGNRGGNHANASSTSGGDQRLGAGGGGAGGAGQDVGSSNQNQIGSGGVGTSAFSAWGAATNTGEDVSGTYYYAGGGSGGGSDWVDAPSNGYLAGTNIGGYGGGGDGAYSTGQNSSIAGQAGATNTGGGAGGSAFNGSGESAQSLTSANGGSGIVIIRYAI